MARIDLPGGGDGYLAWRGAPWGVGMVAALDAPSVSPVVRAFVAGLDDAWSGAWRARLAPYLARVPGSAGSDEAEEARAWLATDWLARVHAPAFLRLAGLDAEAHALVTAAPLADFRGAIAAQRALFDARRRAAVAAKAASAVGAAGGVGAARAASREAGAEAAGAAGGAGIEAGAGPARAARSAAWEAAGAAWDAPCDDLRGCVEQLQAGALEVLERMLE